MNQPTTNPTAPTDEVPDVWVLLTLDPVKQICAVADCGRSREELREARDRSDALYQKEIRLWPLPLVKDLAGEVEDWLHGCGVPSSELTELRREIARRIGDLFHRIHTERIDAAADLTKTLGLDRSGADRGNNGDGD